MRLICGWTVGFLALFSLGAPALGQVRQTPTPLRANLFTATPFVQNTAPTVTATPTDTPPAPVLLEARESAGNVNVRAQPDTSSERLGTIAFGTQHAALRRYFQWYELAYELSPNGRAWVYGELVDIIGSESELEVIESFADIAPIESTQEIIAETTATADARILDAPAAAGAANLPQVPQTALPTFTYPPDIIAIAPTSIGARQTAPTQTPADALPTLPAELPPLFPIVLLGGLGLAGLLLSSIRR